MTLLERLRPWRIAVALFLGAAAVCGPWGNFPLNDDWQYARTARTFAATGRIVVDTPAAPALVGQTLLAAPVIRLFGFSHTALRFLTLALAALGLWCLDRLLRDAGCPPGARLVPLLVLALNPLFFYLSSTFMTEIYGHVPALFAAVLWFHGRSRSGPGRPAVETGVALAVGALMGAAFWTRQTCVVWFAALAAATVGRLVLDRDWPSLRRSLLPLLAGAAVCGAMIALYFPWIRATGNVRPQFTSPLAQLASFDGQAWIVQPIMFVAYMSFFLLPLLLLVRVRAPFWPQAGCAAALLLASYLGSVFIATSLGPVSLSPIAYPKSSFPYLPTLFYNVGVGPMTLAQSLDTRSFPHWPREVFKAVHMVSVLAVALWGLLIPRLIAFLRHGRRQAVEIFLFGAIGAGLFLALTIQAFQMQVFDRYHLPGVIGGVLALGVFLGFDATGESARRRWETWPALVTGLALSLFTVAGVHDHFRWNDARWELVREYLARGQSSLRLHGGYEVNAWLNFDAFQDGAPDYQCAFPGSYCAGDTWLIGMAPPGAGYRAVRSIQPAYWLTPGRWPVTLYERD